MPDHVPTDSDSPLLGCSEVAPARLLFDDLGTVITRTHDHLAEMMEACPDHVATLLHVQLAVHEWLANLVQHAEFGSRTIQIEVAITRDDSGFACTIFDSSVGFDVDEKVDVRRAQLSALPERGMGLLMVFACATDLLYTREADGNTLSFDVLDDGGDRCLAIPF